MTRAILLTVLGLAASTLANSGYDDKTSVPLFDPSEAVDYASTGPADFGASSVPPAATFTDEFTVSIPTELLTATPSGRPTGSPSNSTSEPASSAASSTPSPKTVLSTSTTQSAAPSSSQSGPAQASGTGAARANYPEYIGAIGLIAGLALF